VRLLLDTHILYWSFYERKRLSQAALDRIAEAEAIFVSSASIWEMSIKVRLGKMKGDPFEVVRFTGAAGFDELPLWSRHALLVTKLPMHHTDPFDRLLVAQAISEPLHLLTVDSKLKPYSELVVLV
jgi:PIN domain nuclease of toxin-antitoxin system